MNYASDILIAYKEDEPIVFGSYKKGGDNLNLMYFSDEYSSGDDDYLNLNKENIDNNSKIKSKINSK